MDWAEVSYMSHLWVCLLLHASIVHLKGKFGYSAELAIKRCKSNDMIIYTYTINYTGMKNCEFVYMPFCLKYIDALINFTCKH